MQYLFKKVFFLFSPGLPPEEVLVSLTLKRVAKVSRSFKLTRTKIKFLLFFLTLSTGPKTNQQLSLKAFLQLKPLPYEAECKGTTLF
ncbi:hypothetical protein DP923_05315 [Pontibacter arcticus]|uniref:Uncharacterized protein n=1 Tax=Pontibacter arcticus TaxID=2080288 RepID=A0A364RB30_9BACT|nr:hypothetical protein DP923_16580 [Pontibacter arcticus]RAU81447.1 hypothetical protein DP923_15140 [Pontibacter arcticus]RAU83508.1 hypothetical protein DP923_00010 [Pontibacter arcticus]RAU84452.1 hypothetical protein DP923_05315 [Pontibacter arcticus]